MTSPIVDDNNNYIGPPSAAESTRPMEAGRTLIIDRVFLLLVRMIEVLQKCAAAQSDRLNFLTQWQKAYTDQMDTIHAFAGDNGDAIDKTGDAENDSSVREQRDARDDLNRVNSTYTEELRSRRSVISDDAKSLQTTVNQTSDAANQQTNMATSLLQQLSTILSAIYR
ncbi:MAG: hypothetical protein H7A37_01685 [Chlamydiales bacterium]|nr:hypothetical protein [Chlamydiia bacterium]MCP5507000.1 hypothetical protein [Chlamydiales bacterium]